MTDENIAALDENMPPSDEVIEEVEQIESPEDTATSNAEVSSDEPQVIEIDEKQKALNKLAFEKREEKRQRIALEERLAAIEANTPKAPVKVDSAPTLEQFDYDEQAFNAANIKYQIDQAKREIVEEQRNEQLVEQQRKMQADFNQKVNKLTEVTPDYTESIGQLPEFPSDTLDAIMQADNGPQLAYYLSKHLDIADNVASLPPMQAAMALGRISSDLANAKPTIKPSAAPDPISPVDSSGSVAKSEDDMSMDEIYNS